MMMKMKGKKEKGKDKKDFKRLLEHKKGEEKKEEFSIWESEISEALSFLYEDSDMQLGFHSLQNEAKILFKRSQKKVTTTKLKGISELIAHLKDQTPAEIEIIIPYFLYYFTRSMAFEPDKKVREMVHQVFSIIISKTRKSLGPYIVNIFPFWYLTFFDPSTEVAALAKQNFNQCFPKKKQADVFQLVAAHWVIFVSGHIYTAPRDIMKGLEIPGGIYERLISSILHGLSDSLQWSAQLGGAQNEAYVQNIITTLELNELLYDTGIRGGMNFEKKRSIWTFLAPKQRSNVKAATLECIASFLQFFPKDVMKIHESYISQLILGMVNDNSLAVQNSLWNRLILLFLKTFPDSWRFVNIKQAFLNRLYQCLRKAAFGASRALYTNFIEVISLFPFLRLGEEGVKIIKQEETKEINVLEEEKVPPDPEGMAPILPRPQIKISRDNNIFTFDEKLMALNELFANLFKGLYSEESVLYQSELINSYFNCFLFVLVKRLYPSLHPQPPKNLEDKDKEEEPALPDIPDPMKKRKIFQSIEKILSIPLELFIKLEENKMLTRQIFEATPQALGSIITALVDRNFDVEYLHMIWNYILQIAGQFSVIGGVANTKMLNFIYLLWNAIKVKCPGLRGKIEETIFGTVKKIRMGVNDILKFPNFLGRINNIKEELGKLSQFLNKFQEQTESKSLFELILENIKTTEDTPFELEWLQSLMSKYGNREIVPLVISILISSSLVLLNNEESAELFMGTISELRKVEVSNDKLPETLDLFYMNTIIFVSKNINSGGLKRRTKREEQKRLNCYTYIVNTMQKSKDFTPNLAKILTDLSFPKKADKLPVYFRVFKALYEGWAQRLTNTDTISILSNAQILDINSHIISAIKEISANEAGESEYINCLFCNILEIILKNEKEIREKGGEEFSPQIEIIKEKMIEYMIETHDSGLGSTLWALFNTLLQDPNNSCLEISAFKHLKEKTSIILSKKSELKHREINKIISLVKTFMENRNTSEDISPAKYIIEILLDNESSPNLFISCDTLRLFTETVLIPGIGFDLQELFPKQLGDEGQFHNMWVLGEILKVPHLVSSVENFQYKQQIFLFIETMVMPFLFGRLTQGGDSNQDWFQALLLYLVRNFNSKRSTAYAYALQGIIQKMADQNSMFYCFEEAQLERIMNEIIIPNVNAIIDGYTGIQSKEEIEIGQNLGRLITRTFSSISPVLAQYKNQKYIQFVEILKEEIIQLYENSENVTPIFLLKVNIFMESNQNWDKKVLVICKRIYEFLSKETNIQTLTDAHFETLFSFMHKTMSIYSAETFAAAIIQKREDVFKTLLIQGLRFCDRESPIMPLLFVSLLKILSEILNATEELFTESRIFKQKLAENILEVSFVKCENYKLRMAQMEEEGSCLIFEFEYEMYEHIGGILDTIRGKLGGNLNEELLFGLLTSGIQCIQKSGYQLLHLAYKKYIPKLHFPAEENWGLDATSLYFQEEGEETGTDNGISVEESKQGISSSDRTPIQFLNRNIPYSVIECLEKTPDIYNTELTEQMQHVLDIAPLLEAADNIYPGGPMLGDEEAEDYGLSGVIFSYYLVWNAILDKVRLGGAIARKQNNQDYVVVLNSVSAYLENNERVYQMFLTFLCAFMPTNPNFFMSEEEVVALNPAIIDTNKKKDVFKLTIHTLFNFMSSFPTLARNFYSTSGMNIMKIINVFVEKIISPALWTYETKKLALSKDIIDSNQMRLSIFHGSKEIICSMVKDEIEFSVKLRIPKNFPLKSIEVTHEKEQILSKFETRTWDLTMNKLMGRQNSDLLGAILLWKANYDKKFEGVEECLICYSIVHSESYALPKLQCKTCNNKFHTACVKKWFATSHKNKCPFCQNYFW